MTTVVACRIPLVVDEQTARILDGQSKMSNWLYNQLLQRANELKTRFIESDGTDDEAALTVYSKRGLRNLVPQFKKENPFLYSVHSSPLKNAALRLTGAIQAYQRERKKGNYEYGWPTFRKWKKKWFSLQYDEPFKGYKLDGRTLTISCGVNLEGKRIRVQVKLANELPYSPGYVKQLRIVKEIDRFYAVFSIKRQTVKPKRVERVIALDPNHKNLAYGVGTDGQAIEIENMPNLKTLDRRIDELKVKRDHCKRKSRLITHTRTDGSIHRHWEPSRRWKRYNQTLDKLYKLRREQTKTYTYTVANALCRQYDLIAVGDYTPRGGGITTGMRRAMNNQSLIGRFKLAMAWTAEKSGKHYVEFNERGTTRTCSCCGHVVKGGISPEIREWVCPSCDSAHIRDENAAINGLRRTLEKHVPCLGHRTEVLSRCTWWVAPTGVYPLPGGVTAGNNQHRQDELNWERGSSQPK